MDTNCCIPDQDYKEYSCGAGIFVRQSAPEGMSIDKPVLGHAHNFDHVTFVTRGSIEVSLLKVLEFNVDGNPLRTAIEFSRIISAEDEVNWLLVMKGRLHMLRAVTEGARYQCTYASRLPQALTEEPGRRFEKPLVKRDEDGVLWYREDPKIVDTCEWVEAYR